MMNPENDEVVTPNDALMDAILQQWLGERTARALDADELLARVAKLSFADEESVRRLDEAVVRAGTTTQENVIAAAAMLSTDGKIPPIQKPVVTPAATTIERPDIFSGISRRLLFGAGAAIAASLLIVAGSYFGEIRDEKRRELTTQMAAEAQARQNEIGNDSIANPNPLDSQIAAESPTPFSPNSPSSADVELERTYAFGELPFKLDSIVRSEVASPQERQAIENAWTPDSQQMLVTTNSQFEQLWKRLEVSDIVRIDTVAWADRVSTQLLGTALTAASKTELASQLRDESDLEVWKSQWLTQILASDRFVNNWSDKIADEHFGFASRDPNGGNANGKAATQSIYEAARRRIKRAIQNDESVIALWKDFLSLPIGSSVDLAVDKNVKLDAEQIEKGVGAWWLASRSLDAHAKSSKLLAEWSVAGAACAKCHSDSKLSKTTGLVSWNEHQSYWTVSALAAKFDIDQEDKQWNLTLRPDQEIFYEHFTGDLQIAEIRDPMARNNDIPKAVASNWPAEVTTRADVIKAIDAVANWSINEPRVKHGWINMVWSGVFRRPLISPMRNRLSSSFAFDDSSYYGKPSDKSDETAEEGELREWRELEEFLASQVNKEGQSLRSLLTLMVTLDAFQSSSAEVSAAWYLTATEENIRQLRRRTEAFAFFSPAVDRNVQTPNRMVAWLRKTGQINQQPRSILAQPAPQVQTNKPSVAKIARPEQPEEMTAGQVEWLLHSRHPEPLVAEWIDLFSRSKTMDWESAVNHIYAAATGRLPSVVELAESRDLLDISGSRSIALSRLAATLQSR